MTSYTTIANLVQAAIGTTGYVSDRHGQLGAGVIIGGGTHTPHNRRLSGQTHAARTVWLLVCVSNNPTGCRTIARRVVDALDGRMVAGAVVTVTYTSSPIEDRSDPTEWRWSATVEATHHPRRTHA